MMVWNTHGLQDARRRRSLLLKLTAWRHSREREMLRCGKKAENNATLSSSV